MEEGIENREEVRTRGYSRKEEKQKKGKGEIKMGGRFAEEEG